MLESRVLRQPGPREQMVLAAFSYRYDSNLVPGLIENIAPAVHGYVAWDDRGAGVAFTPETERRQLILAEARRLGARWILAVDPDERFEDRLAARMPEMIARGEGNLWMFSLREMFSADSYRTDGIWGGKSHMRLFPMRAVSGELTVALHGLWIADSAPFTRRDARINLYHLRMASPVRRRLRRDLYAAADPERRFQTVGYDYLDDERGMRLEPIPEGRGFSPPFIDDGGTWSPVPSEIGTIVPDAFEQRLAFIAQSVARQGHAPAYHALRDLCAASPQDEDLKYLAAETALTSGLFHEALDLADDLLAARTDDIAALTVRVRACLWSGRAGAARDAAEALARMAPESMISCKHLASTALATADFAAPDAWWRRWITGAAICRDGARVRRSDMAVVVIGFQSPPSLGAAVASLLAQEMSAEIVVVNTGGGDVSAVLGDLAEDVRLITVEEPMYVGAARNIGIDASRAPFVAFLAGDCLADRGWIAGRLARHRAGAMTVATPVMPERGAGAVAEAANRFLYWGRRPDTPHALIAPFGRSYDRRLFDLAGYFPVGLRVSEDERLNRLADQIAPWSWAPDVVTRHHDPDTLSELVQAHFRRGLNRADHPPFRAMAQASDRYRKLGDEARARLRASYTALDLDPRLRPGRRRLLKTVQWLASLSDRFGTARGLSRLVRAEALAQANASALTLAEAVTLDPQDWRKLNSLATAQAAAGEEEAVATFRRALALAPQDGGTVLQGLVRFYLGSGRDTEGLAEAERAALMSPRDRRLWEIAAGVAHGLGKHHLAIAHSRRALALAPNLAVAHGRLADYHRAAGNPVGALFRDHTRTRLASP